MNIEQKKMEAQEGMDKEQLEEARTLSETGELSDEELGAVEGGSMVPLLFPAARQPSGKLGEKKPWPALEKKVDTLVYNPADSTQSSTLENKGAAGGTIVLL